MSSVREVSTGIGASGVLRSGIIATIDLISTANGKAIGGLFERTDRSASDTYSKVLHDEGLETFWATIVSSLLAKISSIVTPWIPEQIAIIPGKLMGETWHWLITSEQSTNKEKLAGKNGGNNGDNIFARFFDTFVKRPSDFLLALCGLKGDKYDENGNLIKEGKSNFIRYLFSQIGIFGLASFALKGKEENLPGVNIDAEESLSKGMLKGFGYTLVEQATYGISQSIRFYTDFKEEFDPAAAEKKRFSKSAYAKSLANVINERFFPGHILLGISSAISTYSLGRILPKTTAAAIGEFPMAILNRVFNCRRRRATCFKHDENNNLLVDNQNNKPIPNWQFHASKAFNKFLDSCDSILNPWRVILNKGVAKLFNVKYEELENSFNMNAPIKKVNLQEVGSILQAA